MKTSGPLSGVTIIDLTRVLAGPYCTMVLADLGARVIKVELPSVGDDARYFGPFIETPEGKKSAYFASLNRGKESIALDLKDADDLVTFRKLLGIADVLVENFRPGTMEKLGLGWEVIHNEFPKLIYAATSGFGHTGPYSKKTAYDLVVQAMGGLMSLTGQPNSKPTRVGASIGDIIAGMFTAIGLNAALYHREKTGDGQKIDVAMLDSQVAILENAIARYSTTGELPEAMGARHPSIAPFDSFKTADGYIVIAAGNDSLFSALCNSIGQAELAKSPFFKTNELRRKNSSILKEELEKALSKKTVADWVKAFEGSGVPSGPINKIDQVLTDPQIIFRNMVVTTEDKITGPIKMAGNPIKMSSFVDPTTRSSAPELDSDRKTIINELAQSEN